MARSARKSVLEKLKKELDETLSAIGQYESCLDKLREKERSLTEQIELEQFKEITAMLNQQGLTLEDLKEILAANTEVKQSA